MALGSDDEMEDVAEGDISVLGRPSDAHDLFASGAAACCKCALVLGAKAHATFECGHRACLACWCLLLSACLCGARAPCCPECEAVVSSYDMLRDGEAPQHVRLGDIESLVLPGWHRKYMGASDDMREGTFAVTLSCPAVDPQGVTQVQHLGGIYSTHAERAGEPRGAHRRDFLRVLQLLGRVAHHWGGRHSFAATRVESLGDVMDVALADRTLLHQAFTAFMTPGLLTFDDSGGLVPPGRDVLLDSYSLQRQMYGSWAACEISRKLVDVYRVSGLQGLVTSMLHNPSDDRALGALMKLGLAASASSMSAAQRRRLAQCDATGVFSGGFPAIPEGAFPYVMCDNVGLDLKPGFLQFIILLFGWVSAQELQETGMLDPVNHIVPEKIDSSACMGATTGAWLYLHDAFEDHVDAAILVAEYLSGEDFQWVREAVEMNEVPEVVDIKLQRETGSAAMFVALPEGNTEDVEQLEAELRDCLRKVRLQQVYQRHASAAGFIDVSEYALTSRLLVQNAVDNVDEVETRARIAQFRAKAASHVPSALGATASATAPGPERELQGNIFTTNRLEHLAVAQLDLSQIAVVRLIVDFCVKWGEYVVAKGGPAAEVVKKMGVWLFVDGDPARKCWSMMRSGFHVFSGPFHMQLAQWNAHTALFFLCVMLPIYSAWRMSPGQVSFLCVYSNAHARYGERALEMSL